MSHCSCHGASVLTGSWSASRGYEAGHSGTWALHLLGQTPPLSAGFLRQMKGKVMKQSRGGFQKSKDCPCTPAMRKLSHSDSELKATGFPFVPLPRKPPGKISPLALPHTQAFTLPVFQLSLSQMLLIGATDPRPSCLLSNPTDSWIRLPPRDRYTVISHRNHLSARVEVVR